MSECRTLDSYQRYYLKSYIICGILLENRDTAVGVRCADQATLSIRKSWH
jgi:hypothetical protein